MAESSEALDSTDVTSAPSTETAAPTDVAADSSTAEGVKAPASPLEAVKAALEASKDSEQTEKPATESPTRDADVKESKTSSAETQNEGEDQNFSKEANKRIRTLVSERNAARQEMDSYRQAAESYKTVVDKVRATGASAEQVDQAVQLLYLMNNNPAKAFEVLSPIYQRLESFVGNRLPADLQEKVDSGYVDEESARELARLRNAGNFSEQRHQQFIQQQKADGEQQALGQLKQAIGQASSDWESEWKGSDPDYQRKMPFVMAEIKARIAERGGIGSPQEAVEIADAALKTVNDSLSSMIPKREVRTVTGGFQSGNAAPKPRSPLEAARLALGR